MRNKTFAISRHTLTKTVIGLWVFKGAYFYLIWRDRTFSTEALDDGALNLGAAGLGLWLISATFVALQLAIIIVWGRRSMRSAFLSAPLLATAILVFSITSVAGYVAAGGSDFWHYWVVFALPFVFVVATSRARELALFCMRAYGLVVLISVVYSWVAPDRMTMASGSTDLFQIGRLAGFTAHPNVMGATAAFVGICARILASPRERLLWIVVAVTGLLMAQSKTAIAGFVLVLACDWVVCRHQFAAQTRVQVCIGVTFALGALTSPLWVPAVASVFARDATLTGRTDIWEAAIQLWLNRPLIGNGPEVFDAYFRWLNELSGAESAHNQTLETLVSSGVVGFAGLTFFLCAWVARIGGATDFTRRRFATALLVFVSVRCMSEATLAFVGPDITFVIVLTTMALLLAPVDRQKRVFGHST